MKLAGELNSAQVKAASYVDGPLLVLAGAGSGKTRVLTYRITHLIKDLGIDPYHILAVTFTNKAAAEMKDRITQMLGHDEIPEWVGTFHSLSAKILRTRGSATPDHSSEPALVPVLEASSIN